MIRFRDYLKYREVSLRKETKDRTEHEGKGNQ